MRRARENLNLAASASAARILDIPFTILVRTFKSLFCQISSSKYISLVYLNPRMSNFCSSFNSSQFKPLLFFCCCCILDSAKGAMSYPDLFQISIQIYLQQSKTSEEIKLMHLYPGPTWLHQIINGRKAFHVCTACGLYAFARAHS